MPPRPNPNALRRGPRFPLCLPLVELDAAKADAAARGLSLAGHVRALLRQWRKEHPTRR